MSTNVNSLSAPAEVPASSSLLIKKHFNPTGGHFPVLVYTFQLRAPCRLGGVLHADTL